VTPLGVQKEAIIVAVNGARGGEFIGAARVRCLAVVGFFSSLSFLSLSLRKHVNSAKIKSYPPFSFYFNCGPRSFDFFLFVLNSFYY
jgi:hypothetical protein